MAGARVLIIEDNPANLELMTYLLNAFGHTVLSEANGLSGIEAASREDPDLVICDIQLPDIDGFEVARRMQENPAFATIPLVAVTALAMVGDRDRVLAAGFDGYVPKPIDPETFVRQMEGFLHPRHHTSTPSLPGEAIPIPSATLARGVTILAVDNQPVNLELARCILGPFGYKVLTAGGVAEGLSLIRRDGCDLILSDVCMFHESGYDFLEVVRGDPELRSIPFLLITSTLMGEKDREKGLRLGASRFLRRPIEPEELLAEIRACLNEAGVD